MTPYIVSETNTVQASMQSRTISVRAISKKNIRGGADGSLYRFSFGALNVIVFTIRKVDS